MVVHRVGGVPGEISVLRFPFSFFEELSWVDSLDLFIFPDDHRSAGVDRTLDDLFGGLTKGGLCQLDERVLSRFLHYLYPFAFRYGDTNAFA